MAKHIAKQHKTHNIRISRQQVNCPFCNMEYINLYALLAHLQIRKTYATWKPRTCNILEHDILTPNQQTTKYKWEQIQIHNKTQQTPHDKEDRTKQYIAQLSQMLIQKENETKQIAIWKKPHPDPTPSVQTTTKTYKKPRHTDPETRKNPKHQEKI